MFLRQNQDLQDLRIGGIGTDYTDDVDFKMSSFQIMAFISGLETTLTIDVTP